MSNQPASPLPPADPWDKRTGIQPVAEFPVDCTWDPVNEDWASVTVQAKLDGEWLDIIKPALVRRVYRTVAGQPVEQPALTALAWAKRAVASGGVAVLNVAPISAAQQPCDAGPGWQFRWNVQVGSRLSVAMVVLGGDLDGIVRLVPVE